MEDNFEPLEKVELAMIRAEHQKRYQIMIEFIKEQVGQGIEYKNSVVRVVASETGVYYEMNDLPEEFCGAVGDDYERRFVKPKEAVSLLTSAVAATQLITPENTRQFQLIVLYTRRGIVDRKNCYIFDYAPFGPNARRTPLTIGKFQPGIMPLFYKIKVDADFAEEALGFPRGIAFCMANAGDRHLLIRILYTGNQMTDLGSMPTSTTVN